MHINVPVIVINSVTVDLLTKIKNTYMVPKNQKISKAQLLGGFFFFFGPLIAFGCY